MKPDLTELNEWIEMWNSSNNFTMPIHILSSDYPTCTLSTEEITELIDHANLKGWHARRTLGRGSRTVHPSKTLEPIQKIKDVIIAINNSCFKYEIDEDDFECVIHKYQNGMGFGWHVDINAYRPYCKLSCSTLLSSPEEFTGGELIFFNADPGSDSGVKKEQGAVTIFPSFNHHMVSDIVSGTRYALVFFFYGPKFR